MTAFVQVRIDDDQVMKRLDDIAKGCRDLRPVLSAFGDYLVKETVTRFDREQDPDGRAWQPLSATTLALKKNKTILTESTDLRNSFHRQVGRAGLKVGTDRPYAAAHQFGLKQAMNIRPHRRRVASRSKSGVQSGVAFVKAHTRQVNLPARPFLGFTAQDRQELIETIKDYLLDR